MVVSAVDIRERLATSDHRFGNPRARRTYRKSPVPSDLSDETLRERVATILERQIRYIPNDSFDSKTADDEILGEPIDLAFSPNLPASGVMPSHVATLCVAPLLGPAEEQVLFRRMNFLLHRAAQMQAKLTKRRRDAALVNQLDAYLAEAEAVKNRIVSSNVRLVVSIAKKLTSQVSDFDEVISDGLMAMMRAVEKFDFDRGFRFSTYATMVVRRQIYRSMKTEYRDRSRFSSTDNGALGEQTLPEGEPRIGFQDWKHLDRSLTALMEQLDPRERTIIRARFGFDSDGKKQTLQSLAEDFGVCKERVRQLEKRAMEKLRKLASETELEAFVDPEFALDFPG